MPQDRSKTFRLIETADNFVKYAAPGKEARAAARARRRYEKAGQLAEQSGDDELVQQVRLRIADLERRAAMPVSEHPDVDDDSVITSLPPAHAGERVPPGQRVVRGWPVLHEGPIPRFNESTWNLVVDGACARPLDFGYRGLKDLPIIEMTSDFHC
ncbi:MAG: hypothetical protein ACRDJB_05645, partial [Actinomycetota bacterium]